MPANSRDQSFLSAALLLCAFSMSAATRHLNCALTTLAIATMRVPEYNISTHVAKAVGVLAAVSEELSGGARARAESVQRPTLDGVCSEIGRVFGRLSL